MGYYYSSGGPPNDEEPGGWKETFAIILVVFRTLALPLGIIIGAVAGLLFLFWLFTLHVLAGLGAIFVIVLAVAAYGVWEARHPPELP